MQDAANTKNIPAVGAVLDRLEELGGSGSQVTIAEIQQSLGSDAFGPVLLALGLVALSPIGDIPGSPTILSLIIMGVAVQMAGGRENLWIPELLAKRKIKASHMRRVAKVSRPCLKYLGYIIKPRLSFLTEGLFARAIASVCAILALTLPPLEFVPFGATIPSSLITSLSLALVARDGLLTLITVCTLFGAGYYAFTQLA